MGPLRKTLATLTADDLMSRYLLVLSEDTPLREAAHMLIRHQVSGAPVIDRHGRFAGVLSALDFVRAVNDADRAPGEPAPNPFACRFQINQPVAGDRTLCTLPLGTCAVQRAQADAGGRTWVECSHPHDVFVDWQVAEVESLPTEAVGQFMTRNVVTASRCTPLPELARMMIDAHIHRVVITDDAKSPVGIVTSTDILGAVAGAAEPIPAP